MPVIDKRNFFGALGCDTGSIILDIGCGAQKRSPEYVGIDALDFECVDIVGDVFEVLSKFPDASVDAVFSAHFFEHIPAVDKLLKAIERILKPGGKLKIIVPHFSNPYFYSDYTHRSFFGLYSFSYLADESLFKRKVPKYQLAPSFDLIRVYLRFQSPFYSRSLFYKFYGAFVNAGYYLKELYEENFSRIIYCYEIEYDLVKKSA